MTRAAVQQTAEEIGAVAAEQRAQVSAVPDFDSVYAQNVGFVWRVLRGMGVSDVVVEDAVQDVFMVVHRRLAAFDGRHSIRTWLFAIAYRVARDHLRRARKSRVQDPIEHQLRDVGPTPDQSAERAQQLRVIAELLDRIDDEKRVVLVLTEFEGMTAQEIADATGVGLNTVYTRLRRARLQLNEMLAARQKRTP